MDFEFNTRFFWYNHISVLYLVLGNTWISNHVLHALQKHLIRIVLLSPSNTLSWKRLTSLIKSTFKTMKFEIYHERQGKNGLHSWMWDHPLSLSPLVSLIFSAFALISWKSTLRKLKSNKSLLLLLHSEISSSQTPSQR